MSRQQRRAAEREEAKRQRREEFDRVHGQVLASRTIAQMYRTYREGRFGRMSIPAEYLATVVEPAFYAGAAAMLELMQRVGPDGITEDQGVEMLQRLTEELETYTNRVAGDRSNA